MKKVYLKVKTMYLQIEYQLDKTWIRVARREFNEAMGLNFDDVVLLVEEMRSGEMRPAVVKNILILVSILCFKLAINF